MPGNSTSVGGVGLLLMSCRLTAGEGCPPSEPCACYFYRTHHRCMTMCYSAQVSQALRNLARRFGADIDYRMFDALLAGRLSTDGIDNSIKISKALEANFLGPDGVGLEPDATAGYNIRASIDTYRERLTRKCEAELFTQRKRQADARRKLQAKTTKKALEDDRIATEKIAALLVRLADLR